MMDEAEYSTYRLLTRAGHLLADGLLNTERECSCVSDDVGGVRRNCDHQRAARGKEHRLVNCPGVTLFHWAHCLPALAVFPSSPPGTLACASSHAKHEPVKHHTPTPNFSRITNFRRVRAPTGPRSYRRPQADSPGQLRPQLSQTLAPARLSSLCARGAGRGFRQTVDLDRISSIRQCTSILHRLPRLVV